MKAAPRFARAARHGRVLAIIGALALVVAACTTSSNSDKASPVTVSLTDFKVAATGHPNAGEAFVINVKNDGKVQHNLTIDAAGKIIATPMIEPAGTATLSAPELPAGTYAIYCTVAGHREAGMQADLVVGAGGTAERSMTSAEMMAAEKAVIGAFPAKTAATGGLVLAPTLQDGVKVFELTPKPVRWEVTSGQFVDGYGYNGQIPGPQIRVRRGDRIKIIVRNELPEATTVHWHGLTVPNAMDGVPFITQPPIEPGKSFTYAYTVKDLPGTYMYHSHENALAQVGKGLLGSFIIEPAKPSWDIEQTVVIGDGPLGFTLNGKGFPATAPIVAKLGQRVLLRFMNAGQFLHPMHLHGFHFEVVTRDGQPVTPYTVDTLTVAPGERYDVRFIANEAGTWALHCHILSHVESERGMFGMVTAVIVK